MKVGTPEQHREGGFKRIAVGGSTRCTKWENNPDKKRIQHTLYRIKTPKCTYLIRNIKLDAYRL